MIWYCYASTAVILLLAGAVFELLRKPPSRIAHDDAAERALTAAISDLLRKSAGSHVGALDEDALPPFDPDPELVADVEGNPFALRAFRQAAETAHERAENGIL